MDRSNDTPTDWRTVTWYERRVHFIGIGGSGMSGLAAMLLQRGAILTGTDQQETPLTKSLAERGATIALESDTLDLPDDIELVVASAAVPEQHPTIQSARGRGLLVMRYAEMLGMLFDQSAGIAVAGTHGKSTTTAWITYVLRECGFDPSYVVGAVSRQLGGGSGVGRGEAFVAEACEYNRSFLNLHPELAVILNIDEDHLDYFDGLRGIQNAFAEFISQVSPSGSVIANGDSLRTRAILDSASSTVETFGLGTNNTWRAADLHLDHGCYSYELMHNESSQGRFTIGIPGMHNVMNSLAVIATAHTHGVGLDKIRAALPKYNGVDRRFEIKGKIDGVTVLDDYAHHPTEIRATLSAIRERLEPKRLWCIFQPHQHSRTRFLLADFAASFHDSDVTIVPDIYFVRDSQTDREAVNAHDLVQRIAAAGGTAEYIPEFEDIVERLAGDVQADDVVVTMGAGTIWKVADALVQRLQGNGSD